jgi:hypothetical protein
MKQAFNTPTVKPAFLCLPIGDWKACQLGALENLCDLCVIFVIL